MSEDPTKQADGKVPTWTYQVVAELCYSPEIGQYHTYGIRAIGLSIDGNDLYETIHDVSVYRPVVEKMARAFTQGALSPIHLLEATLDFLP